MNRTKKRRAVDSEDTSTRGTEGSEEASVGRSDLRQPIDMMSTGAVERDIESIDVDGAATTVEETRELVRALAPCKSPAERVGALAEQAAHTLEVVLFCAQELQPPEEQGPRRHVAGLAAAVAQIPARIEELVATCGIDDPTGTLRTVIECALKDDPNATAADIRAIWDEATEDARIEREMEVRRRGEDSDARIGNAARSVIDERLRELLILGRALWRELMSNKGLRSMLECGGFKIGRRLHQPSACVAVALAVADALDGGALALFPGGDESKLFDTLSCRVNLAKLRDYFEGIDFGRLVAAIRAEEQMAVDRASLRSPIVRRPSDPRPVDGGSEHMEKITALLAARSLTQRELGRVLSLEERQVRTYLRKGKDADLLRQGREDHGRRYYPSQKGQELISAGVDDRWLRGALAMIDEAAPKRQSSGRTRDRKRT